jgi:hypothetical protein
MNYPPRIARDTNHRVPATGSSGPDITAPAVRTNLCANRAWVDGRPVVVVFHGRDNRDAARALVQSVRNVYRHATSVVTVNVVDLSMFPRVLRRVVNSDLEKAFDAEAANLPGDRDPESHVIIVADYDGSLTRAWGVSDADTVVSAVVLDGDWLIRERSREPGLDHTVLAALGALTGSQPATSRSAPAMSAEEPSSTATARQQT